MIERDFDEEDGMWRGAYGSESDRFWDEQGLSRQAGKLDGITGVLRPAFATSTSLLSKVRGVLSTFVKNDRTHE